MELSKDFPIKDFQGISFAPFNRPMFLIREGLDVERALGYVIVCSPEFVEYNCSPFGTFILGENGIVYEDVDYNNGHMQLFASPIKRNSWAYKTALSAHIEGWESRSEKTFLEECASIGLEITD